ncbi:DUF1311 domain-containing protein [Starkeya sp. 3C]|uniref:DUF1311 domain-containing protein n=1 Tax=Ancylobacter moscoviensis TaxID=2597768 RepID=A0ABY3DMJ8_9HYPH|nr:lysozyme inhibitor LprI family protein [Ancylobacter moscoviensis]TSJ60537.1 DUF1311 domain-containing protein [Ancylobacter moscoviensis]
MPRPAGIARVGAVLLGTLGSATAAEPPTGCTRGGSDARAYLDCLNARQKASEETLARAEAGVEQAIAARQDLPPPQRNRWRALFEESQSRFVLWRNFECQSIAPFEGSEAERSVGGRLGGIGVLEQRMVCLIIHNEHRASDLADRYAPPGGWKQAPPVAGEASASPSAAQGQPTAPVSPTVNSVGPDSTSRSSATSGSVMPGGTMRIIEMSP